MSKTFPVSAQTERANAHAVADAAGRVDDDARQALAHPRRAATSRREFHRLQARPVAV
jgi:hypothetical protein